MKTQLTTMALTLLVAITPVFAGNVEVVTTSDIKWEALNPARGDKSPQAGTLWGDRKGSVATGFLAKFVDGFSSPPHIHNVTYRAVVISGLIHNDDPDAAEMWMPAGSFWTQPKGEVHITAAKGSHNVALVEISKSPYLVRPPMEAFDDGERPVNVDVSNLVWVDQPATAGGTQIAFLWGKLEKGQSNGTFLKLPAGFSGEVQSQGNTFRAVVISGKTQYLGNEDKSLDPGSYFGSKGATTHKLSSAVETVLYIRTNGEYKVSSF